MEVDYHGFGVIELRRQAHKSNGCFAQKEERHSLPTSSQPLLEGQSMLRPPFTRSRSRCSIAETDKYVLMYEDIYRREPGSDLPKPLSTMT